MKKRILAPSLKLLRAYCVDREKSVVGKIAGTGNVQGSDVALNAAFMAFMATHLGDGTAAGAYGLRSMAGLMRLI